LKVNDENSRIRIRIRIQIQTRIHQSKAWIRGSGSTPICHGSGTLLGRIPLTASGRPGTRQYPTRGVGPANPPGSPLFSKSSPHAKQRRPISIRWFFAQWTLSVPEVAVHDSMLTFKILNRIQYDDQCTRVHSVENSPIHPWLITFQTNENLFGPLIEPFVPITNPDV
jgi:hypothetical protein